MPPKPFLAPLFLFLLPVASMAQMDPVIEDAIGFSDSQMRNTLLLMGYPDAGVNPDWAVSAPDFPKATTGDSGDVAWGFQSRTGNWGAGFTPGLMWDLYDLTGDLYWLGKARAFTDGIEVLKTAGGDMRMNIGFHFMNSYARRIAHDGTVAGDLSVMDTAANHLATNSWMPAVGSLWSFSWGRSLRYDGLQGGWSAFKNTIIDSAPNLEILFHQAKIDSDLTMWERAVSHMNNLVRDNIREDGSTAQLVSYDTETGEFLRTCGHQGYSYFSTWSRGQGWGMHGFASAWRETRDPAMGEAFHDLYTFYRDNCPEDGVPYWDFIAPDLTDAELEFRFGAGTPALRYGRDTSAAALAASSLLLACQLAETDDLRQEYFDYAVHILTTLATPGYLAEDGSGNPTKESILGQGTYSFPGTEKGQIWGDFFFVEALRRYQELVEPESVFDADPGWGDLANYTALAPHLWKVQLDQGEARLRMQGKETVSTVLPADFALYRHASAGDFSASFSFRADENLAFPDPVIVVFVFGYEDEENYCFLKLGSESGTSGVYAVQAGIAGLVASIPQNWSGQGYHDVTISRTGDSITVSVDASPWGSLPDPAIAGAGGIGFGGMGHSLFFDGVTVSGSVSAAEWAPYMAWKAANYAEPLSMFAADFSDLDRDGRSSLMEYAMGTDPHLPDVALAGLVLNSIPTGLELSYPFKGEYSDLSYQLVRSMDGGQTWLVVDRIDPLGTGGWNSQIISEPLPASGAALYRLQVERVR